MSVPLLRFKPSDSSSYDEWVVTSFKDVATPIRGLTYKSSDVNADGVLVLRSSNIQDSRILLEDTVHVRITKGYRPVKPGDILLCTNNGSARLVGKSAIIPLGMKEATHGGFMTIIEGDENPFVFQYMQTDMFHDQVQGNLGGIIGSINISELRDYDVSWPIDAQERKRITDALTAVDTKIDLLVRKRDNLARFKAGLMQKIFSQEVRFTREDGSAYPDWEEKVLEDVAAVIMGQSPSSSSYNDDGNGLPLIQGNADTKAGLSAPRRFTSAPTKECSKGDILISVRAPVGDIAISIGKACIGRGVAAIRAKASNDHSFIHQFLLSVQGEWERIAQGSTFTAISGPDLRSLQISTPSLDEQIKISSSLIALDHKIENVHQQITTMQAFKKGLLQQMFV